MIVYIAINHKLESREKIVGGGEKKKSWHKTTRSLFNRKQSDGGWLGFRRKNKQALTGLF